MRPACARRGVAFIVVLWVIALLTVLLGSFTLLARTEALQSRHLFDSATARFAAEAGLHRAVLELSNPDLATRWIGDGRSYSLELGEAEVAVTLTDESGKIDINVADEMALTALFQSAGLDEDEVRGLVDAVLDWRDADDLVRAFGAERDDYAAAGYTYGPSDRPFATVEELQQVMGMTHAVFRRIEPAITVHSGSAQPNPFFATLEALMTLPGMDEDLAREIIAQRQLQEPGMQGVPVATLPDGTPIVAQPGGLTYSVRVRATLPNGAWTELDATIRLGAQARAGRPFQILRWRDSD
ncbi:MAG TPA: type II secretion system protein GspK, partial [Xanthomonadaceae bacterium]|nr:type II secretion system protein GspK [Xanthomonadaceae bacterium]